MGHLETSLSLVRHGETEENVAGILQGRMPGTLTSQGLLQIRLLRESIIKRGKQFDVILTSPLRRAHQTALMLNEELQLPLHIEPLLQERDWGTLTGHTVAEARALKNMPADIETVENMSERARKFLSFVSAEYADRRVLAVTHGLFARCIQAVFNNKTIREIPVMKNTEVRELTIEGVFSAIYHEKPQSEVVSDK